MPKGTFILMLRGLCKQKLDFLVDQRMFFGTPRVTIVINFFNEMYCRFILKDYPPRVFGERRGARLCCHRGAASSRWSPFHGLDTKVVANLVLHCKINVISIFEKEFWLQLETYRCERIHGTWFCIAGWCDFWMLLRILVHDMSAAVLSFCVSRCRVHHW